MTDSPAYQEWFEQQTFTPVKDKPVHNAVLKDLEYGASLSQFNYTLWRKHHKIQNAYDATDAQLLKTIEKVKRKIWIPKKPDDYLNLEPEVIYVQQQFPIRRVSIWGHERFAYLSNPDPLNADWTLLGDFVSTGDPNAQNPGRNMRFLVRDKKTKKYLGIISLAGDYLELSAREKEIGWTRENRSEDKMIEHTAGGKVIVPLQPLGYSYVGGKLMSLLLTSEPVCSAWEEVYGKKLVGITTTSLFGKEKSATQYDGLKPYWKNLGYSAGSATLRPSEKVNAEMREWMRNKHPEEYWKYNVATRESGLPLVRSAGERAREFCYKQLEIPRELYQSNHERGIYFSKLYEKSFEFLRKEIDEKQLQKKRVFDNSVDALVEVWKTKYAFKRVESLLKDNRFSYESSFYDEMIGLSWDETLERFGK